MIRRAMAIAALLAAGLLAGAKVKPLAELG
jgi:hypothetical protein